MILLQAIRLDAYGRFQYRIDAPDQSLLTGDAEEAAKLLGRLGVRNPAFLIVHVQVWGSVELPDHPGRATTTSLTEMPINEEPVDAARFQSVVGGQSESKNWPAEKLWDLRFCARHRLPLHKAASFLGRTETEVREKAAELGLKLLEEDHIATG